MTTTREQAVSRGPKILVLLGIVCLSFNLRPAVVSIGPVLDEIIAALGMSPTVAGVLTTLPVLAFASFGALAPWLARSIGVHRVTLIALLALTLGLAGRSRTGSVLLFLLLSVVALAGMATANVLLPSLVKLHFPNRVGLLTSIYTTAMAIGLTLASVTTVPISQGFGSWRWGLFAWAITAIVAAGPWIALSRHDKVPAAAPHTITLGAVARTRLGWWMAIFFGLQSLQAYSVFGWFAHIYQDAGFSASVSGLLLGVIPAVSIPLSFVLPSVTAKLKNPTALIVGLLLLYPIGYTGLIVAPVAGAWLWAVIIGTAASIFPVALTLIGLRSRTSAGTAALSGFTQSVGYLIAAIGPFGIGLLFDLTGGWTLPLAALALICIPQLVSGIMVGRTSYIEDQLQP